jgi:serine/threonine protein kinase/predicted Zn-dependent peptidase
VSRLACGAAVEPRELSCDDRHRVGSEHGNEPENLVTVVAAGPPTLSQREGDEGALVTARSDLAERVSLASADPLRLGRFRVLERMGQGGMGVVYAAHDDELDRDLAIKLLHPHLAPDLSGRERLLREAQAIAKLSHPNTVHVYEVGTEGDRVFMAMELIRGPSLRRFCAGKRWQEIVDVFIAAGEGLAAAHAAGVIHRDFKPDNVIVDERGRPRVVDFGLARAPVVADDGDQLHTDRNAAMLVTPTSQHSGRPLDLTRTGTVLGTPAYMAPEQFARADPDARTDQFAFSVSLFEMLYNRRPFPGSTYTELVGAILKGLEVEAQAGPLGVPRALRQVVLRGLARDPEMRFASMDAMLGALRKARAPRQRRALAWAGVAALTAVAVVQLSRDPPSATPADPPPAVENVAAVDPWQEIVAATRLPETLATAIPGDPTGVTVHRLRNGLTVYIADRPLEPKVAITVAVRAGSEQERDWGPGLAYLVMMALHRGGERIGVLDAALERPSLVAQHALLSSLPSVDDPGGRAAILRAVDAAERASLPFVLPEDLGDAAVALGGELGSRRSGSGTVLAVQLPEHRIDGWLEIVAEAVQRPAFRDLRGQVQAQLALYASTTSNEHGWQVLQRELAAATGLREDYETASAYMLKVPLADARAFHDSFYRPNNVAVVLVGDVDVERALPMIEKHFGAWVPAAIPTRPALDRPLPDGVVRREIEDAGSPAVFMAWPLPPSDAPGYADMLALKEALGRHDGLGAALRSKVADVSWNVTPYRSLEVRTIALPGQSLAQAEAETISALEAIAGDALPDAAWDAALARAELSRLRWARTQTALAETIATSFIEGRSWRAVATELTGAPTRERLVAAAAALLQRSRVVVHKRPGETWHVPVVELPGGRLPTRNGRPSAFVRAIVDAPIAPPEPRFLVAGSHYELRRRGNGRVITTEHDGPLAIASWVVPVGVDDDAFVCDAMRARVWAVRIPGIDFDAYCTNDFVWVDVVAPAARFEREASFVFEWLEHGIPSDSEIHDYIERTLQTRASRRMSTAWREPTFHAWALRGEHGIDANMPDDDTLRRRGAKELPASLARLTEHAADLLYVGPAGARIRALVPPGAGREASPRVSAKLRALPGGSRDRVFVLHDPTREDAVVRVALPWPDLDPRTSLAAEIHAQAVSDGLTGGPPTLAPRWGGGVWWTTRHPLATTASYACAHDEVLLATRTAIELVRRELPPEQLAAAQQRLEIGFRALRTPIERVPETVRLWETPGTDPRVAQWLALPSLEYADLGAYYDAVAEQPVVISIVGDAEHIDLRALASIGELTRVELAAMDGILRDPEGSDG